MGFSNLQVTVIGSASIANISTRLIANKASIKTKSTVIDEIMEALK